MSGEGVRDSALILMLFLLFPVWQRLQALELYFLDHFDTCVLDRDLLPSSHTMQDLERGEAEVILFLL